MPFTTERFQGVFYSNHCRIHLWVTLTSFTFFPSFAVFPISLPHFFRSFTYDFFLSPHFYSPFFLIHFHLVFFFFFYYVLSTLFSPHILSVSLPQEIYFRKKKFFFPSALLKIPLSSINFITLLFSHSSIFKPCNQILQLMKFCASQMIFML